MRLALFVNPKARWFRDDPSAVDALYKITSGRGVLATPTTEAELMEELKELRDAPPTFLAVAGGDGTVSKFTTALLQVFDHDALPEIGLLHAGTMNTISKSMGNRGTPVDQLEAYVAGQGLQRTRRFPLRVGFDRWGYLFGTGIIPRYIQAYDASGDPSPAMAGRVLGHKVMAALSGRDTEGFFEPIRADITVDGQLYPLKRWLLLAAGAVDDMGLGFRPFPRLLDKPGAMGLFATASKPWRFAMDLPSFRLDRPVHHSLAFQDLANEIKIRAPEPILYNLDGDVIEGTTTLRLSVGPPITFLLPPSARQPRNQLGP